MDWIKNKPVKSVLLLLLLFAFSRPAQALTIDKIVAVVNNEVILQSDVSQVLAAVRAEFKSKGMSAEESGEQFSQIKKNIINQMVEEKLILSEAKRFDIKVKEELIDARINEMKAGLPNPAYFDLLLAEQDITLKQLRSRFYDQEIMKQAVDYFVRAKIKVDPNEIREYYQQYRDNFFTPEEASVKSFLVKVSDFTDQAQALAYAQSALERLKNSEQVDKVTESDLGVVTKGQMLAEVDKAIFSLSEGGFSGVVKTPQGYRIFKLEKKHPRRLLSFLQAQDKIREMLYKERFSQRFKEWLDQLKQEANIQIKEELNAEEK